MFQASLLIYEKLVNMSTSKQMQIRAEKGELQRKP